MTQADRRNVRCLFPSFLWGLLYLFLYTVVKRYTSSSPKSHSLWICSECAILKSKYSLKKISQIISIFHTWGYINELLPMTQHQGSMNCESAVGALWVLILDDTHHTRKANLGGGGVMGEKRNPSLNLLKYIHSYNRNLYPKKSLPLIA